MEEDRSTIDAIWKSPRKSRTNIVTNVDECPRNDYGLYGLCREIVRYDHVSRMERCRLPKIVMKGGKEEDGERYVDRELGG